VAKLPRITAAELVRALRRDGWYSDHQTGSHLFLRHTSKRGTVIVPVHSGVIIKPGTLLSILRQAGMDAEELRQLL
jgi:predicted RNA binding protein YcfA (HicA-like mRNA interferase family)